MTRVLIADDAESLRLVVRITVESQSWGVLEAANGYETIATATAQHPDLILLDLNFADPTLDGIEVCRQLKAASETAEIPVVVLTASERAEDRERAMLVGATDYLTKPFGPLELLDVLRRVLGQYLSGAGLGLYLVDAGVLTAGQLERTLIRQRQLAGAGRKVQLGALLVEHEFISQADLEQALARQRQELGLSRP